MKNKNYLKDYDVKYLETKEFDYVFSDYFLIYSELLERCKDNNYTNNKLDTEIIKFARNVRILRGQILNNRKEYSLYGEKRKELRRKAYTRMIYDVEAYLQYEIYANIEKENNIIKISEDEFNNICESVKNNEQNKIIVASGKFIKLQEHMKIIPSHLLLVDVLMVIDLDSILFEKIQGPTFYLNCYNDKIDGVIDLILSKFRMEIKKNNNNKIYMVENEK